MQILRKKWKIGVPFGKKGKRLCPSNTVMLRKKLCCEAKPFSYFLQTAKLYYIQGHSNFSKKAKALSKVVEGRSLHSARFKVNSEKVQIHLVRRNKKILRYCLDFSAVAGHGAAWKRLCKKQEAGPGAVRRRGLRF